MSSLNDVLKVTSVNRESGFEHRPSLIVKSMLLAMRPCKTHPGMGQDNVPTHIPDHVQVTPVRHQRVQASSEVSGSWQSLIQPGRVTLSPFVELLKTDGSLPFQAVGTCGSGVGQGSWENF